MRQSFTITTIVLLLNVASSYAETEVAGTLTGRTVWKADEDVLVTQNVEVPAGAKLVVEPGVTVRFEADCRLTVSGELQVLGSQERPVRLTSASTKPERNDWTGILFQQGSTNARLDNEQKYQSGSILSHAIVEYSGGVAVLGSSPLIEHTTIRHCRKKKGGGLYLWNSHSLVRGCHITRCYADDTGGGVRCEQGHPQIVDCTISHNWAKSSGGGISTDYGKTRISGNVIEHNAGVKGGGIGAGIPGLGGTTHTGNSHSLPEIRRNTIRHNFSSNSGGGVYVLGTATITDNRIHNNVLGYGAWDLNRDKPRTPATRFDNIGGGICLRGSYGGPVDISGNLIVANRGAQWGGGLHACEISGRIFSNLVSGNQAAQSGGGMSIVLKKWGRVIGSLDYGTQIEIEGNTVTENGEAGIEVAGGGQAITIRGCNLDSNVKFAIANYSGQQVAAETNFYGTTAALDIEEMLFDQADHASAGRIVRRPASARLDHASLPEWTDRDRMLMTSAPVNVEGGPALREAGDSSAAVGIGWEAPAGVTPAGYRLYFEQTDIDGKAPFGSSGRCREGASPLETDAPGLRLTGLTAGETYRFAVSWVDDDGRESGFSEVLTVRAE
jgi:parallel beta-helix repeat protein